MAVIGNKLTFGFELVPVAPSWRTRYDPEKAAWAGTAVWVDGKNLCRHVMPGSTEIEDYFYIPLGPIVDCLVRAFPALEFQGRAALFPTTRDLHGSVERWFERLPPHGFDEDAWLDAREEWWSNHFLRAGLDGAHLPDLAFVRDDEQLAIGWSEPWFFGDDARTMVHLRGTFAVPWEEGRAVLAELASTVAAWFRESDAADVYRWAREDDPLGKAEPPLSQAIELFTGHQLTELEQLFGADGFPDLLKTLRLDASARDPAASPPVQVLRDLSPDVSTDVGEVLIELGDLASREQPESLARWQEARSIARDAARAATSPEKAGQLAAHEMRRSLSLDGQPIADVPSTLSRLGLSYAHASVEGGSDRMMVAVRDGGSPVARTLETRRTAWPWAQRFEACRALGHVLLDPIRAGALGAASGPFAEDTRRRRSGAFAAELLLPQTAIAQASGGRLDGVAEEGTFTRLLTDYGVGAYTAAYQSWNRGWLSSEDIRDELIERFAAADSM